MSGFSPDFTRLGKCDRLAGAGIIAFFSPGDVAFFCFLFFVLCYILLFVAACMHVRAETGLQPGIERITKKLAEYYMYVCL